MGLIKILLCLAVIAGFVWLLVTNRGFAQVVVELLRGIFSLLLFLLIALFVLAVVLILGVTVMYIVADPSRTRRSLATRTEQRFWGDFRDFRPDLMTLRGAEGAIAEQMQGFGTLFSKLHKVLGAVLDIDESEHVVLLILHGIHFVLFGMREHLADLEVIHQDCNREMAKMIRLLSATLPETKIAELEAIRRSKTFFPKEGEWEITDEMLEDGKIRFLMRLAFLNRGWREWFTIWFKLAVSMETLSSYLDLDSW